MPMHAASQLLPWHLHLSYFFPLLTATISTTTSSSSSSSTASTISYPKFQDINVKQTILELSSKPIKPSSSAANESEYEYDEHRSENSGGQWKLKLVHRDKLYSLTSSMNKKLHGVHRHHHDHRDHHRRIFEERMKRDARRVAGLVRRLGSGTNLGVSNNKHEVEDFGSEVVPGMDLGSGEYFVRIGVGSPARSQYMVIDPGSDIVWVQCQPCSQCYHQADPIFIPVESASYAFVPCSSSVCDQLENAGGCHAGRCRYEVSYGDGSFTRGTLSLETLTLGRAVIKNVAIGCGHMNQGMFVGAAGLLGLGGGSLLFVGQLGRQTGGRLVIVWSAGAPDSPGLWDLVPMFAKSKPKFC